MPEKNKMNHSTVFTHLNFLTSARDDAGGRRRLLDNIAAAQRNEPPDLCSYEGVTKFCFKKPSYFSI